MNRFLARLAALLGGAVVSLHAMAAPPGTWPTGASRSHVQCPWRLEGPDARVFTTPRHWQEMMTVPEDRAVGGPVDWRFDNVIVFAMETQRTLGVKVQLAQPVLELQGKDARLEVQIIRPRRGEMVAAALSRPCVAVKVPKRAWRVLEVRNGRNGAVLVRSKIRSKH